MSDPLVSTAWLAERLDSADIRVIDAAWFMPGEGRMGREAYEEGHIPGAVFFDIDGISDRSTDLPHMLLPADAFAEAAGALGLRRDLILVVYDGQGIFSAPRVWWTLRTMGFPEVFVLDGGLLKWRAEGRPLETSAPVPTPSTIEPAFDPSLVRDLEEMRQTLEVHDAQVVDARAAARFRGEVPEPRSGLRSGHMPGARNVPWNGLINADGTMKSAGEIRTAFEGVGVNLDDPIVTTCGSGVSAALLALALARLGREDVAVYDGSWTEWGGRADTPVATGT
jgi:thiosulfate/3-mercaptopyruvate sulfurtransferase